MMRHLLLPLLTLGLHLCTRAIQIDNESPYTLYIIRHGEKNWLAGCLSDQGQARANALPEIFNGKNSAKHETFKVCATPFQS